MGREIRMVPAGWEHPRGEDGNYIPLHDDVYQERVEEWDRQDAAWNDGTHPDIEVAAREYNCHTFAGWDGPRPDREDYADYHGKPRTHWQAYENVSEGTPVSPVFADPEDLIDWIAEHGLGGIHGGPWPREAAARFVLGSGWIPSMAAVDGRVVTGAALSDKINK